MEFTALRFRALPRGFANGAHLSLLRLRQIEAAQGFHAGGMLTAHAAMLAASTAMARRSRAFLFLRAGRRRLLLLLLLRRNERQRSGETERQPREN